MQVLLLHFIASFAEVTAVRYFVERSATLAEAMLEIKFTPA